MVKINDKMNKAYELNKMGTLTSPVSKKSQSLSIINDAGVHDNIPKVQKKNPEKLALSPHNGNIKNGELNKNGSVGGGGKKVKITQPILYCKNPANCYSLKSIVDSFKSPLSEEQAWALIYQLVGLYSKCAANWNQYQFNDFDIPDNIENVCLHRDGSIHCFWPERIHLAQNNKRKFSHQQQQQQHQQQQLQQQQKQQQQQQEHQHQQRVGENFEQIDHNNTNTMTSYKKILRNIAIIVYSALDYHLQADEQCQISQELEELINYMTADLNDEDAIDEGIDEDEKRWNDDNDDKFIKTHEFDYVLEACKNHIKPITPDEHYPAVCRAIVTESIELQVFLQQVLEDGAGNIKIENQSSKQELAKLGFTEWARFWVQVIDELRRGVRLKKNNYERTPTEYELTPYEILMEDIRSKKYQLRKVMINGDIPPRIKKDAHDLILEFIRSRPPLKKASDRQLPPPIMPTPSPREQLMDSIRKGQKLKHIVPPVQVRLKDRLLPASSKTESSTTSSSSTTATAPRHMKDITKFTEEAENKLTSRSKQRLIKVDLSLLQDDEADFDEVCTSTTATNLHITNLNNFSQPQMPPYPIEGHMLLDDVNKVSPNQLPSPCMMRRSTNEYATTSSSSSSSFQSDSTRTSFRRHTIVGCQSNPTQANTFQTNRNEYRKTNMNDERRKTINQNVDKNQIYDNTKQTTSNQHHHHHHHHQSNRKLSPEEVQSYETSTCPWNKSFLDEQTWKNHGEDHLSLTLDEIVHIRSVITKAQLEGLPVGIRIREEVEKRKICFLCLRTRFWLFGPWGIQCKLCQRTVCSKCSTKMSIPMERNIPLVLISPSLLSSPAGSSTPSPLYHSYSHGSHSSSTGDISDETFPKSLIERLLRSESDRKSRYTVGSAPASPRYQRTNTNTPSSVRTTYTTAHLTEIVDDIVPGQAVEALSVTNNLSGANITNIQNKQINIMSRSMDGPRSLPMHNSSPLRQTHSTYSTLDRNKFSRAFTLSQSSQLGQEQKENLRGELASVCNDCRGLVMEITRTSRQTKRSSARNRTIKNLTLDLSPVYK